MELKTSYPVCSNHFGMFLNAFDLLFGGGTEKNEYMNTIAVNCQRAQLKVSRRRRFGL